MLIVVFNLHSKHVVKKNVVDKFCIFISTILRYKLCTNINHGSKRNAKIAIPVICDMKKKSFLIAPLHWNALALCQIKKFLQTWQKMQNLILQIALFTFFCIIPTVNSFYFASFTKKINIKKYPIHIMCVVLQQVF